MALHCSSGRDKSVKCDTSKVTLQRSTAQEDGYLISRGPLIMRATSIRIPSGCYRLISPRHAQPLAMFADHPFSGRDLPTLSIAIARGRRWLDEVVAGTVTSGGCFAAIAHSRLWQILLQKSPSSLCEIEICNDRIGARAPLNRCCAFAPDLESMLRDKMLKILLQHNRHQADLPSSHDHVRLARRSGNHLNVLRFPLIAQKTYSS
jgi:hypothetical protein